MSAGRSAAEVVFAGTYAFTWENLPADVRSAVVDADAPVAACDIDDSEATVRRRRDSGEYFQPVTVWRATRAGVSLIRLRHRLRAAAAKKYTKTGVMDLDAVKFWPAAETPNRRTGVIGDASTSSVGSSDGSSDPSSGDNLDYLPGPVIGEVRALIPDPIYTHSTFLQYSSHDDRPYRHLLRLLRMDNHQAVVVTAERKADVLPTGCTVAQAQHAVAALPWTVTRYLYRLAAPQQYDGRGRAIVGQPRSELR